MKRLCFPTLALLALSAALPAWCAKSHAAEPDGGLGQLARLDQVPQTPEIWLYLQQLQRHDDPKQAIRRRAEFKAEQRRNRLATAKWFGISNARPQASPTPIMGSYSPYWGGGGTDPYRWWAGQRVPTSVTIETFGFWR